MINSFSPHRCDSHPWQKAASLTFVSFWCPHGHDAREDADQKGLHGSSRFANNPAPEAQGASELVVSGPCIGLVRRHEWAVSSAVEHCVDIAVATGSIPVPPTIFFAEIYRNIQRGCHPRRGRMLFSLRALSRQKEAAQCAAPPFLRALRRRRPHRLWRSARHAPV
jgi:hypothetical protein